ncbi:septation protein SepH [Nocardioides cavernaquae]|uniref:DUF3071 domain-containing protein n=1 Tax=Nocardioides cavernaquae TaxID=2321396 RepID=A0A3A5HC84_9ACTN|nr:septation protein SepH [Nocardioides cavernaquae]RJS47065.1 DUF3071 domain-containing protein [Nocardioides cavernaquae]
MQHLSLAGLSEDGRRLLMVDGAGQEFSLDVDVRLRAALRGDSARLGQLETKMESTLRPRDIQARIRSGESPEDVALAAKTTVEKILPYANPVLAEREHVARRAQGSSVRRRGGLDSGARTLGDAVAGQLRALNVDPESVEWDAWRREDGRWALTAEYSAGRRQGHARFAFDAPGNYVTTENDDARWLIGDPLQESEATPKRDDLQQARERRQAPPVAAEQLVFDETAPAEPTVDLTETAARVRENPAAAPAEPTEPTAQPAAEVEPEPEAPKKPATKRRGRASVPSWDEIMFGGGQQD